MNLHSVVATISLGQLISREESFARIVCRAEALVECASYGFLLPFHLICDERMDLISTEFTDIPEEDMTPEERKGYELSWVASEPREIESWFISYSNDAFTMVENKDEGASMSWIPLLPRADQRFCSSFQGTCFMLYEFTFKEAGIRIYFTDLQTGSLTG